MSDWVSFRVDVTAEKEAVDVGRLMQHRVEEKLVNAEAALEALEQEVKVEVPGEARAKEKKKRREEKQRRKREVAKKEAKKVDISIKLSDEQKKQLENRRSRGSEKAKHYDEKQKQMQARADRQWKAHLQSMVPRDFTLPPEVQKIVDEYDGSLKPPEYCYRSPKRGTKVQPREPDKEDKKLASLPLGLAKKILRLAGADYPCLIAHQDCMREGKNPRAKKHYAGYDKLYFKRSTMTKEEKISRLPDFGKLKLGSCALVGNADNLLKGKYGKEIDEHDFVARFNVVTKPYKASVGTRADGIFFKVNYKNDLKPSMFNFFPKYVPKELDPKDLPGGKPALIYGQLGQHEWRFDIEQMFWSYLEEKNMSKGMESFGVFKLPHTTGGITRVRAMIQLLRLGVCDRLDIYGFSVGGGKYFDKRKVVSRAHPVQSENYFYRLWMATGIQGKFCVYGK
ncbi:hypothetical protein A3770_18p82530 [Chloropicon primus]|uniref:Sialyltransferase n=1 Tax=Chloropicon primus TaxID=1764295 RepID=A0A5B8N1H7_9CHLO|nr:hypothetical protein A3770_18p82530 [Chloropicon primus]|eukprot:QDZ25735.1 hypothetical protein A3770_18p82530 [Chloropicon primus]